MQRTFWAAKPRPPKSWATDTSKNKKLANIAIAGTGVLVAVGLGAAVVQDQRAESFTSYTPAVTYTPPPKPDTALFIGDSYTAGVGASAKTHRWTTLLSKEMRWVEANYGLGGTGYVTTAGRNGCGRAECPTYPDRLAESMGQVGPEFVVIAGGQNDFSAYQDNPNQVEVAIRDSFAQTLKAYPEAEIIAVGPSDPGGTSDVAEAMDAVVREEAEAIDAEYVSLIDPPVIEDDMVVDDGSHVNNEGHAAIAERVLETLRN